MVLLDVGVSMRLPLRERVVASDRNRQDPAGDELQHTRFAAAVAAVENVVQQKVIIVVNINILIVSNISCTVQ